MKKSVWLLVLTFALAAVISACGAKSDNNANSSSDANSNSNTSAITLKVGASAEPHAKILKAVKEQLAEQGIKLEIIEFTDYVQPNVQVYEKQLDANFFQHTPYLEGFNDQKGYNLVKVVGVHIEPIGAYSSKLKSIDELKDGAKVAIPNDATNGGRALALLEKNNLIKLKDGVGINGTVQDIVDNAKNLKIIELEAATLPRALADVDVAVINTNYALEADLVPMEDALFIEDIDSPYVNILVSRPDNKDSEAMQKLAAALNSDEVRSFIETNYQGAVVPAF